jgi:two-component system sensor histidine kinase YesM
MFIGIFISSRISTYIAKPINMLVNTMKDITKGNRNVRADENGESEIKILNRSFNTLMDTNDKLISEVYEKQKCIRNFEFLLLQEQIKPHFLYNSLATVSSLVKLDLKKEAVDAIQNLAKFYRMSLSDGNEIITIKEEISMIESYLIILEYKYIDTFYFSINIDKEILNHNIPKLTLQPLIENAIDHGIKPKNEKTEIIVEGKTINNNIVINVKDYGVGISEKKLNEITKSINSDSSDNFGLTCVNQRLKYMYGNEYGLSIESIKNKFTNVTINLPKEEGDIIV